MWWRGTIPDTILVDLKGSPKKIYLVAVYLVFGLKHRNKSTEQHLGGCRGRGTYLLQHIMGGTPLRWRAQRCPKGSYQPPATHLIICSGHVHSGVCCPRSAARHPRACHSYIHQEGDRPGRRELGFTGMCFKCIYSIDNVLKLGTFKVQPARGGRCCVGSNLRKSQW